MAAQTVEAPKSGAADTVNLLKTYKEAINDHAKLIDGMKSGTPTIFDACVNGVPIKYSISALLVSVGDEETEE